MVFNSMYILTHKNWFDKITIKFTDANEKNADLDEKCII